MPDKYIDTTPYWTTSSTFPPFVKLAEDAETDVVVVGGGITGLTTAYLLVKAGKRVVVLERGRCAMTDTGHTSAHLTMVTDTRISELVKRFGRNHAQAVWDAGLAAIATIDETVREHDIAGFEWVDGYLHAPFQDGTRAPSSAFKKMPPSLASSGSIASSWSRFRLLSGQAFVLRTRRVYSRGPIWPVSPRLSWRWAAASMSTQPRTSSARNRGG